MHKRKKQPEGVVDVQPLLTIEEVATILNVGRTTVYGFIARDGLPVVPLSRRGKFRVMQSSLLRWIAEREVSGFREGAELL